MRGRKPKPRALKVLEGNPGKRALPNEPDFGKAPLDHPPPKSMHKYGRELWLQFYPKLQAFGVLQPTDLPAFEQLCRAWALYKIADDKIANPKNLVQTSQSGYQSPGVWIGLRKQAQTEFKQLAEQFGLTPSARSRVKLPSGPSTPGLFGDIRKPDDSSNARNELAELLNPVIGKIGA